MTIYLYTKTKHQPPNLFFPSLPASSLLLFSSLVFSFLHSASLPLSLVPLDLSLTPSVPPLSSLPLPLQPAPPPPAISFNFPLSLTVLLLFLTYSILVGLSSHPIVFTPLGLEVLIPVTLISFSEYVRDLREEKAGKGLISFFL